MTDYIDINNSAEFDKLCSRTIDGTKRNLKFKKYKFNFNISISETLNVVSFEDCIFNGTTKFYSTFDLNATFKKVVFKGPTTFANSHFKSKTRFHQVSFVDTVNFDNTKFDDLADFWASSFNRTIIFYKTDFLGITVFSRTTFKENVLFTYTLIDKVVIFRGTRFNKGLDLSLSILNGNFNVFDIRLKDFNTVDEIDNEDDYEDSVSESGIIPEKNKRETFKLLKTQLKSQGNNIDSLRYSNLEIATYHKELYREFWKERKYSETFDNYFILQLNAISNKNGKSWVRGILFTIIVAGIFFYLAVLSTDRYCFALNVIDLNDFSDCLKLYFEFLTPTHKVQFLDDFKTTPLTYLVDFLGRAFVAYGIYQTIQAFRKYRSV